jgi:hypothetical protein
MADELQAHFAAETTVPDWSDREAVMDPLFPYGHALELAKEIPGARLLALEQTGHELPQAAWDVVVSAILEHTSGGDATFSTHDLGKDQRTRGDDRR